MRGKNIAGLDNREYRFIGSLSNTHNQKLQEMRENESMYRDPISGVLQKSYAESIIEEGIEKGGDGYLILFDIRDFLAINEKYGMIIGNTIVEEIGGILLNMKGILVDRAENGQVAVEKFMKQERFSYDLILMDIQMPVMNGLEATKKIRHLNREDAKKVPIIAMTANAFNEDMKKSIQSGMNGQLSKPIDMQEFEKILKNVLKEETQ